MTKRNSHMRTIATATHVGQDVPDHIAFPLMFERLKGNARLDTVKGCWLWTKYLLPTGYAESSFRCKKYRAHRLMYIVAKGDPGDLHVMHSCDVRHCVNPDHLSLGTNHQNMLDAMDKGRPHRGNLMRSKTHCPRGHLYAETARLAKGRRDKPSRACTVCQRMGIRKRAGWPDWALDMPPQPLGHRPDFGHGAVSQGDSKP